MKDVHRVIQFNYLNYVMLNGKVMQFLDYGNNGRIDNTFEGEVIQYFFEGMTISNTPSCLLVRDMLEYGKINFKETA